MGAGRVSGSGEYLLEFIRQGGYVRVAAVDPVTNTEVVLVGSASATRKELTRLAVRLARESAVNGVWVAGSMAPLEDCFSPELTPPDDELEAEHEELARGLAEAGVDLMLRAALKKANLHPRKDVNIVEVRFPTTETMLREGKIHAGVLVSSFLSGALERGGLRRVFAAREVIGGTQFVFPVVLDSFLEKNFDVLADFLEDYLHALTWFRNPANRDKALDLAARYTKRPRKSLVSWAFKRQNDFYRSPDGEPDLATLQKNIDLLANMKFIKSSFDVTKYADLRPLRKAQARFKAMKK